MNLAQAVDRLKDEGQRLQAIAIVADYLTGIASLEQAAAETQARLDAGKAAEAMVIESLGRAKAQLEQAGSELEAALRARATASDEASRLIAEAKDVAERTLTDTIALAGEQGQQIAEIRKELAGVEEAIDAARSAKAIADQQLADVLARLQDANTQTAHLEERAAVAQAVIDAPAQKTEEIDEQLKALNVQIVDRQDTIRELDAVIEKSQAEIAQVNAKGEEVLAAYDAEITSKREELAHLQNAIASASTPAPATPPTDDAPGTPSNVVTAPPPNDPSLAGTGVSQDTAPSSTQPANP